MPLSTSTVAAFVDTRVRHCRGPSSPAAAFRWSKIFRGRGGRSASVPTGRRTLPTGEFSSGDGSLVLPLKRYVAQISVRSEALFCCFLSRAHACLCFSRTIVWRCSDEILWVRGGTTSVHHNLQPSLSYPRSALQRRTRIWLDRHLTAGLLLY